MKLRVELGAGRVAAQAAAGVAVLLALPYAVSGAVLWYLHTDSVRVAFFTVAACYLAFALIAGIAILVISLRQRKARRETSISSAFAAALLARPATVMNGGSRVLRIAMRRPLTTLGGAVVAGLLLTAIGSRGPPDQA